MSLQNQINIAGTGSYQTTLDQHHKQQPMTSQLAKTKAPIANNLVIYKVPLRIRSINDPKKWFTLFGHNSQESINQLYEQLLIKLDDPHYPVTMNTLLDICQQDPAKSAIVLTYTKHQINRHHAESHHKTLSMLEKSLEEQQGALINAGLNTANTIALFTHDHQLRAQFRQIYYINIMGKKSVNALFNAMTDLIDEEHMYGAFSMIRQVLQDDLLSNYPSCSPNKQIQALMTDASIVSQLSGLFSLGKKLLGQLQRNSICCQLNNKEFIRRIVNMTTSSFYLRELQRFVQDMTDNDQQQAVTLLNYYYRLLKNLPNVLWTDHQQRNNTLKSVLYYTEHLTHSQGDYQLMFDQSIQDKQSQAIKQHLINQTQVRVIKLSDEQSS